MKKLIVLALSICLILSVAVTGAGAQTNYCQLFNSQWSQLAFVDKFGNEETPWGANDIAFITSVNLGSLTNFYNSEKSTEFNECYSVPREQFEARAKQLFDVTVDIRTTNYSGMRDVVFDSETNTYDIKLKPAGGGAHYHVCGYQEKDGLYTVYMQLVDYDEYLETYIKCVGRMAGDSAILVSCELTTDVPAESELITWNTTFEEDTSSDTSSDKTESSEQTSSESTTDDKTPVVWVEKSGVKVEAPANVLPKNTVVSVSNIADVTKITTILKDYSEKFVAFDITAKAENDTAVQPNGNLTVTFDIPDGYDVDKTVVLYVSPEGVYEILKTTADKGDRTITAQISHLSTYVVAEKITPPEASEDSTVSEPQNDKDDKVSDKEKEEESGSLWPKIIAVVVALALIGGATALYFLYFKKIFVK